MKIVLFSRVPRWYSFKNERLARRLTTAGHEVAGVIVEKTSTIDSLREWRTKLGADVFFKKASAKLLRKKPPESSNSDMVLAEVSPPVFYVQSHNSPECLAILQRLAPDLIVLRGCGIIKKPVLDIPKVGVINPHYAKLPEFRGMDVTEWAVLCGAEIVVTVHTVNEGVDTGVVLRSKVIEPTATDTVGSLRDKSAALVVDLLVEAVADLGNGKQFPSVAEMETGGHQYFQMHHRLKKLANSRLSNIANNQKCSTNSL